LLNASISLFAFLKRHAPQEGTMAMLTRFKVALSLALALGSASTALAAKKHGVHPQDRAMERAAPAPRAAYGFAPVSRSGETYIDVQDQFYRQTKGD
jgi:hypothetical protein